MRMSRRLNVLKLSLLYVLTVMECKGNSTLYLKLTWENYLNMEIPSDVCYNMCETQHTC